MQPELEPPPEDVEVYKPELSAALRDAYDHVHQLLAASHETQKGHYDKRRRQVSFEVGDLVRLRTHPRSDASAGFTAKLAPLFKGLYRVERVMSDLNYRLSRVFDDSDAGVHHVVSLLPFFTWGGDAQSHQEPLLHLWNPPSLKKLVGMMMKRTMGSTFSLPVGWPPALQWWNVRSPWQCRYNLQALMCRR
ncbi:hypothetical protein ABVT39_018995 [Epinephelus coioides]